MSETIEEVIEVGRRHHLNPTLLEIDVRKLKRTWNRYQKKGRVYTADYVPPDCIKNYP